MGNNNKLLKEHLKFEDEVTLIQQIINASILIANSHLSENSIITFKYCLDIKFENYLLSTSKRKITGVSVENVISYKELFDITGVKYYTNIQNSSIISDIFCVELDSITVLKQGKLYLTGFLKNSVYSGHLNFETRKDKIVSVKYELFKE